VLELSALIKYYLAVKNDPASGPTAFKSIAEVAQR
jgi:hypothetical protein